MTQENAFLQAILENPADDTARLIYADWLEDRGNHRGEFIRVQCELAQLRPAGGPVSADDSRGVKLENRERELLGQHADEWLGPLPALASIHGWRRGFIEGVTLNADVFLARADELFRWGPVVHEVTLLWAAEHMKPLAACRHLSRLTSLRFATDRITAAGAQALAGSPHLARLAELSFGGSPPSLGRGDANEIGDEGAQALAASPKLAPLINLDLSFDRIGDAGARALATSPHFAQLTWLDLGDNEITGVGVQALIDSPYLTRLAALGLRNNPGSEVPCKYGYDWDGQTIVFPELDDAAAARLQARFRQRPRIF
jgi:uncharacterized protein (TIGR02996 family)